MSESSRRSCGEHSRVGMQGRRMRPHLRLIYREAHVSRCGHRCVLIMIVAAIFIFLVVSLIVRRIFDCRVSSIIRRLALVFQRRKMRMMPIKIIRARPNIWMRRRTRHVSSVEGPTHHGGLKPRKMRVMSVMMTREMSVWVKMSGVNSRIRVMSRSKTKAGNRRVGGSRLARIHPLPHPSAGP